MSSEGKQYASALLYNMHSGLMDDVRLYRAALSDSYIMVLNLHREYMDLSAHKGKVLYIQLNDDDNREGDFAAMTADDFIVSMTADEVKALMQSTYDEIMALEDIAINRYVKQFYKTYKYPFPLEE